MRPAPADTTTTPPPKTPRVVPLWEPCVIFVALYVVPQVLLALVTLGLLYSRVEGFSLWTRLFQQMDTQHRDELQPPPPPHRDERLDADHTGPLTRFLHAWGILAPQQQQQ